ncbi:MAG: PLP-dependent transferase, partial [Sphingopyxis terrae]|nr:PLP-dependent transferase [Sphingopyxis terrae]
LGGSQTHWALEDLMAEVEGGTHCAVVSSGLAAVTTPLLAYLSAGDHCLMPDSVYGPARNFCDGFLTRFGVETTYYHPTIDEAGIAKLMRPNTKVVYTESPGSHTFEVQDAASQYAAAALGAEAGARIVDLCAGGGGKTLAIASLTGNAADILACDVNRARLQQLSPRAERAGATRIETRLLDPGKEAAMLAGWCGKATHVFVDAPCSGSGTWRRSPELRWRLTPARLDRHMADQANLLVIGADLVAPGGKLLYAVCSIIAREGRAQVQAFLDRHRGWTADSGYLPAGIGRTAGAGYLFTPAHDRCDGFFLARLTAPC